MRRRVGVFSAVALLINMPLPFAVSPPQETVQGDAWWTDYQPVSYILQGKRGNREALAAMIDTCHNAGVKVLAGECDLLHSSFNSHRHSQTLSSTT